MEINISVAEPEDAAKVMDLLRLTQATAPYFSVDDGFDKLTVETEAANLDQIAATDDNLVLLAWAGDELVGIATVAKVSNLAAGEVGMVVKPNFQHQGLGTALLDEVIYWAEHFSPLNFLRLTVIEANQPALALYRKLKFETTGISEVGAADGQRYRALEMQRNVQN